MAGAPWRVLAVRTTIYTPATSAEVSLEGPRYIGQPRTLPSDLASDCCRETPIGVDHVHNHEERTSAHRQDRTRDQRHLGWLRPRERRQLSQKVRQPTQANLHGERRPYCSHGHRSSSHRSCRRAGRMGEHVACGREPQITSVVLGVAAKPALRCTRCVRRDRPDVVLGNQDGC